MTSALKDRKFNDPKARIAALFAPCQKRIASGNLAEAYSPMQNYHLKAQDPPNSAGLELSGTSRPATSRTPYLFSAYQATRWSN